MRSLYVIVSWLLFIKIDQHANFVSGTAKKPPLVFRTEDVDNKMQIKIQTCFFAKKEYTLMYKLLDFCLLQKNIMDRKQICIQIYARNLIDCFDEQYKSRYQIYYGLKVSSMSKLLVDNIMKRVIHFCHPNMLTLFHRYEYERRGIPRSLTIILPAPYHVQLIINYFKILYSMSCVQDWMRVFEKFHNWQIISEKSFKYCGTRRPWSVHSKSRTMIIYYKFDTKYHNVNRKISLFYQPFSVRGDNPDGIKLVIKHVLS